MPTLTQVSIEQGERLMTHVDELPRLADEIGKAPWLDLRRRIVAEHGFLVSTLIPHMDTVEAGVHAELDRLLSCRLAMEPMDREHTAVRKLIGQLGPLAEKPALSEGETVELNRVLVKLYAILKIHLREESRYIPILEHNLAPEQIEALVAPLSHAARVQL
jgi:hypothetical protein